MDSAPIKSENPSAILEVIKSPMIFNAFAILVVGFLVWYSATIPTGPFWAGVGFIAAVTIWLNIFAAINPRFLAYGPREYLRESELSHERKMAGKS